MATKAITNAEFDSVVKESKLPVLIDFWAPWCGPCRALGPVIEEISDEKADSLAVYKCNVDEEGDLAAQFGIASIPTMILFKDGQAVSTMVGSRPKADILAEIEKYL